MPPDATRSEQHKIGKQQETHHLAHILSCTQMQVNGHSDTGIRTRHSGTQRGIERACQASFPTLSPQTCPLSSPLLLSGRQLEWRVWGEVTEKARSSAVRLTCDGCFHLSSGIPAADRPGRACWSGLCPQITTREHHGTDISNFSRHSWSPNFTRRSLDLDPDRGQAVARWCLR